MSGVNFENLCGYVGADNPELVQAGFDEFGHLLSEFRIVGASEPLPPQVMLFTYARKLLGADIPNVPQQVGDCVSFGAANAIMYIQCVPILNGVRQVYKPIFQPYLYGTGRVQVGGTRLGLSDGSTGIWQATAVMKYGAIPSDMDGCPAYSGSIARQWGRGQGPPTQFLTEGQKHLVKSAAKVNSAADAGLAIKNGYAVTVASNQGFSMSAGSDGFHHPSGSWGHQMCLIGYDSGDANVPEHFCLLNSWGDVFGKIVDFRDPNLVWPVGCLRVRPDVVDAMIKAGGGDSFIYSLYDGYPAQPLPRSIFDISS